MLYTRHKTLTDNTEQSILTIPNGFVAHIKYVFVANHGGSTNQVDLFWEIGGTPQVYIMDGTSIGSGEILGDSGSGVIFVLHESETVKAQASSATGSVEVVLTLDLLPRPPVFVNFNGA
jgi:hypothetical protein